MMGSRESKTELFSYLINLDDRVRPDHPLRQVLKVIDFSFVREEVALFYGNKGNMSVDPVVIMKLMFLLFFDDVKSERELMRIVPERLDYLWFLGYGLNDKLPNHSVISKARTRWGPDVFEKLFIRTITHCIELGLVGGDKIHMDSSFVRANASKDAVIKGKPELIKQLKEAYGVQERKLDYVRPVDRSSKVRLNDKMLNTTDPDSSFVRYKGMCSEPRYKHHRVVDDKLGVITAVESTSGHISDEERLIPLVEQHQLNTSIKVKTVVADSRYGTTHNFRECALKNIRTHMVDMKQKYADKRTYKGIFDMSHFKYIPEKDIFVCPANQHLKLGHHNKRLKHYEYRASDQVCRECHLRSNCTKAKKHGRTIIRKENSELLEKARKFATSKEAKRDQIRRQYLIEGSFANAANNHHLKRSRWRRIRKQFMQDLLISAIQNIKILMKNLNLPMSPACKAVQNYLFAIKRS